MGMKTALLVFMILAILVLLPCDAQGASSRRKSKPRPNVREEVCYKPGYFVCSELTPPVLSPSSLALA